MAVAADWGVNQHFKQTDGIPVGMANIFFLKNSHVYGCFLLTLLWYSFVTACDVLFNTADGSTVSQLNFAGDLDKKNSSGV